MFSDLPDSFAHNLDTWKAWYDLESPEASPVPDYEGRMNVFQKLVLVRSLRPDRMLTTAKEYISQALGSKYLIFKALDIESTWTESSPVIPLIFLLSPGANPNQGIMSLAKRKKTGQPAGLTAKYAGCIRIMIPFVQVWIQYLWVKDKRSKRSN